MHVRLIAVGGKPPRWVRDACEDYLRRLGSQLPVAVIEIAPGTRGRGAATARAVALEGERVLAAVRAGDYLVTLDERGTELSTREFAGWLETRRQEGEDLAFAIGGPDGLAAAVLARSRLRLALSRLTLPHALARVVLAEQLYRAVSLLARHPYHRE